MSEVISTGIAEPIESADADGNDMLNQADCWHKPRARNLDPEVVLAVTMNKAHNTTA